jgi:hypothetical protein
LTNVPRKTVGLVFDIVDRLMILISKKTWVGGDVILPIFATFEIVSKEYVTVKSGSWACLV